MGTKIRARASCTDTRTTRRRPAALARNSWGFGRAADLHRHAEQHHASSPGRPRTQQLMREVAPRASLQCRGHLALRAYMACSHAGHAMLLRVLLPPYGLRSLSRSPHPPQPPRDTAARGARHVHAARPPLAPPRRHVPGRHPSTGGAIEREPPLSIRGFHSMGEVVVLTDLGE